MAPLPDKGDSQPVDFSFLVHTIPDIPPDATIIGLCTIPPHRAGPEDHGWHVAAFAGWKALLTNVFPGNPQAWISAVGSSDITYGLTFGGKRVHHALESGLDIVSNPLELGRSFLNEISRLARLKKGSKLVVIVCGPTSLGQDVLINFDKVVPGQVPMFIKIEDIQQSADGVHQLMLITPSMLAASWWVVHPNLNQRVKTTAASNIPPDTGKSPISSDLLVKLFARRCAPLFTDQLVTAVFSRLSLYLHERYEAEEPERFRESLWPQDVTPEQEAAGAALRSELQKVLLANFAWFPSTHKFYFFPLVDSWNKNLQSRVHLPLALFSSRWDLLKDARRPTPTQSEQPENFEGDLLISFKECSLSENLVTDNKLSGVFGGSEQSHLAHLQTLALTSFPKGLEFAFESAREHKLITMPTQKVSRMLSDYDPIRLASLHKYAAMSFADAVVFYSKLERPQGQRCIHWDPSRVSTTNGSGSREALWKAKFLREMRETGLFYLPTHENTVKSPGNARDSSYFSHPIEYLWEAIKIKYGHLMMDHAVSAAIDPAKFLNEIPEVFDVIRLLWQGVWQELLDNRVVYRAAKKFQNTVGLDAVDLPARLNFGKFLRKRKPQMEDFELAQETKPSPEEDAKVPTETASLVATPDEATYVGPAIGTEEPVAGMPFKQSASDVQKTNLSQCRKKFDAEALAFLQGEEGFLWATQLAAEAFAQRQQ